MEMRWRGFSLRRLLSVGNQSDGNVAVETGGASLVRLLSQSNATSSENELLLDMDYHLATNLHTVAVPISDTENQVVRFGYECAFPEDVFWHIFSFLSIAELVNVALVRSNWRDAVYSPYMWNHLDLYNFRFKVSGSLLNDMISSSRFRNITVLRLDECLALDISCLRLISIACFSLRELSTFRCRQFRLERPPNFKLVKNFVFDMTRLRKLELYGCCSSNAVDMIVKTLLQINPTINLGLLQLQWSTVTGLDTNGTPFPCRLAAGSNFHARACWGPISGHIVFSALQRNIHGNIPSIVLYSCVAHSDINDDINAGTLGQCNICARMFLPDSMTDGFLCRNCHDRKVLRDARNWTKLDADAIGTFIADTDRETAKFYDVRSLPRTLVPIRATGLLESFSLAKSRKFRRALVVSVNNEVMVYADDDFIIKGVNGQVCRDTCLVIWRHAFSIVYPIFLCTIIIAFFSRTLNRIVASVPPTSAAVAISKSRDESLQTQELLIFAIFICALFCIVNVCLRRFREQCLNIFRRILVIDFFMVSLFGGLISCGLIFESLGIVNDVASSWILVVNFSVIVIIGLYFRGIPPRLRRFSMFMLNIMMAIVMLLTLHPSIIVILLAIPIFFDLYAQFSRQGNIIIPLFLYRRSEDHPEGPDLELHNPLMHLDPADDNRHIDPLHDRPVLSRPHQWTPSLSYQVEDLEMRLFDFLWYGALLSFPEPTISGLSIAIISVLFVFVSTVMICPFFQLDIKPLPLAFLLIISMEALRVVLIDVSLERIIVSTLNL